MVCVLGRGISWYFLSHHDTSSELFRNLRRLEQEISVSSFHRASLRLQRDYALIILSSAMISKLGREPRGRDTNFYIGEEMTWIIDLTTETSIRLLDFMSQSDAYKWYLRWAPTYSALFAVFAGSSKPTLYLTNTGLILYV